MFPSSKVKRQYQDCASVASDAYDNGGYRLIRLLDGFRQAQKERIPKLLQSSYDERTALLKLDGGFQALIVEKNGDLYVGFTGTRGFNFRDLLADLRIIFRTPCKSLRLKQSLAVIKLLLDKMDADDEVSQQHGQGSRKSKKSKLIVVGHSLGGACAQYAVGGNLSVRNKSRLVGVCFNAPNLHNCYRNDMPDAATEFHHQCIHHLCQASDSWWGRIFTNKFWLGTRYVLRAIRDERNLHQLPAMWRSLKAYPFRNDRGKLVGNKETGELEDVSKGTNSKLFIDSKTQRRQRELRGKS